MALKKSESEWTEVKNIVFKKEDKQNEKRLLIMTESESVSCSVLGDSLRSQDPWTVAHQAPLSMEFSR